MNFFSSLFFFFGGAGGGGGCNGTFEAVLALPPFPVASLSLRVVAHHELVHRRPQHRAQERGERRHQGPVGVHSVDVGFV